MYEKYCHLPVEDGRYQVVFHEPGLHKKSVTMEKYFKPDKTFDKQKVIDFKNRFEYACDGHSADRIIAYIDSLKK